VLAGGDESFFKSATYELNYKGMLGLDFIEDDFDDLQNPAAMIAAPL
jgi:hypothetical protein